MAGEGGGLLARYGLPPREIEEESFRRIEARVGLPLPGPERQVALRMIHAAGDPALVPHLFFHPRAVEAGVEALRRGVPVWVDVCMVAAGLRPDFSGRVRVLSSLGGAGGAAAPAEPGGRRGGEGDAGGGDGPALALPGESELGWADRTRGKGEGRAVSEDERGMKAARGLTRLARAVLAQKDRFGGTVFACGNSPTALLAILDLVDAGFPPPALVVATCPGFVAAEEAKEELRRRDLPSIVVRGTRGGSPLAAACLNALAILARGEGAREATGKAEEAVGEREPEAAGRGNEEWAALLLVGHGSRLPEAAEGLFRVAEEIRTRSLFARVEVGFLQLSSPDVFAAASRCAAAGAGTVVVAPYFLHSGAHVEEDLPEVLDRLREAHPGVTFRLAAPLGFHPGLAEVVLERALSALSGDGSRALSSKGGPASGEVPSRGEAPERAGKGEEAAGRGAGGGKGEGLEAEASGDREGTPGLHHRLLCRGGGERGPSYPAGSFPGWGQHPSPHRGPGFLSSAGARPGGGGGGGRGGEGRRG